VRAGERGLLTDDHEARSGRPLPPLADEAANDLVVLGETLQMFAHSVWSNVQGLACSQGYGRATELRFLAVSAPPPLRPRYMS
jgi:hypothetical protein